MVCGILKKGDAMKRRKFLILGLLIFIITGCSVDYDLVITSNHKVKEEIKLYVKNDQLIDDSNSVRGYLKKQIASYKNTNDYNYYDFSYKVGKDISYVQLKTWYPSMERYQDVSSYKTLFENINYLKQEKYTIVETYGKYFYSSIYGESPDPEFVMGDINVKIRVHNKVIENNADKFDEKTNTLEWKITSNDLNKSIYFKLGKTKRYDIIVIDMFMLNKDVLMPLLGICVLIIIISYYWYRKISKNNEI